MRRRLASILGKLICAGITVGLIWVLTLALRRWGVGSLPIAVVIAVSLASAVGIAFVFVGLLASRLIKRLAARVSGYWRRLRRPWSRTLLVDVDPERGTFTPSVWIGGGRPLRGGRVRLRLLDGDDVVRAASEAPLPATAMDEEMHLPRSPCLQVRRPLRSSAGSGRCRCAAGGACMRAGVNISWRRTGPTPKASSSTLQSRLRRRGRLRPPRPVAFPGASLLPSASPLPRQAALHKGRPSPTSR